MENKIAGSESAEDLPALHEVFDRILDQPSQPCETWSNAANPKEDVDLPKTILTDELFYEHLAELLNASSSLLPEEQQHSEWTRRHNMFSIAASPPAPSECSENPHVLRLGERKRPAESMTTTTAWVGEETSHGHLSETEEFCGFTKIRPLNGVSRKRARRAAATASTFGAGKHMQTLESSTASLESCDALWSVVFAPERLPVDAKHLTTGIPYLPSPLSMSHATRGL